jgi:aquaporin Z
MLNKYLIEFLGTLFLSFIIFYTGDYLAIGAALAIGVVLGGAISGGAFNPAITIPLYMANKINKSDVIPYIIVQILAGIGGYELVRRFVKK